MLMFYYQPLNATELTRIKSEVAGQCDRLEPKLGGLIIPVYMYMRRLIGLVAVEVQSVRT